MAQRWVTFWTMLVLKYSYAPSNLGTVTENPRWDGVLALCRYREYICIPFFLLDCQQQGVNWSRTINLCNQTIHIWTLSILGTVAIEK